MNKSYSDEVPELKNKEKFIQQAEKVIFTFNFEITTHLPL